MDWFNGAPVFVVKGLGLYTQSTAWSLSGDQLRVHHLRHVGQQDRPADALQRHQEGYVYSTSTSMMAPYSQTTTPTIPSVHMEVPLNQLCGEQFRSSPTLPRELGHTTR